MKLIKGIFNLIGILAALVLSVPLILMLVMGPILYAADTALKPEVFQEFALYFAFDSVEPGSPQEEMLEQMLESGVTEDLLELYMEDMSSKMEGGTGVLDPGALEEVAGDHMDELLAMFQGMSGQQGEKSGTLPSVDPESAVKDLLEQYAGNILEGLPDMGSVNVEAITQMIPQLPQDLSLDSIGAFSAGMMEYVKSFWLSDSGFLQQLLQKGLGNLDLQTVLAQLTLLVKDYRGLKLLGCGALVLSLLILFFRMGGGYRGLFWLGSDYLIGGGLGAALALVGKVFVEKSGLIPQAALVSACQKVLNALLMGSTVIFAVGVVFAVSATIGNGILERRKKKEMYRRW